MSLYTIFGTTTYTTIDYIFGGARMNYKFLKALKYHGIEKLLEHCCKK